MKSLCEKNFDEDDGFSPESLLAPKKTMRSGIRFTESRQSSAANLMQIIMSNVNAGLPNGVQPVDVVLHFQHRRQISEKAIRRKNWIHVDFIARNPGRTW